MAVEKHVPVSEAITYVEFSLSDTSYPFVAASAIGGGQTSLEEIVPREEGFSEFFSVTNTDPDEVYALATDHGSVDVELLARHDDGALFEFVMAENCPAIFLCEQGALPRRVDSADGKGHVAAEIPADVDEAAVVERFLDAHPDADLARKQQQSYVTPMFTHREFQDAIEELLTDRQREVLAAAHDAGYYEWPRDTRGEDIAAEFDISAATFHQHLRAAEQKLIGAFFERPDAGQ